MHHVPSWYILRIMEFEELKTIEAKFSQGIEKLNRLTECFQELKKRGLVGITIEEVDTVNGELTFYSAGTRYYVRIRITDRSLEDIGTDYKVPLGWLDWGSFDINNLRMHPDHSNFYDDKGVFWELEGKEFYSDLKNCEDEKLTKAMLLKLQRLAAATIARNNTL